MNIEKEERDLKVILLCAGLTLAALGIIVVLMYGKQIDIWMQ